MEIDKLLLVDDDDRFRKRLAEALEARGVSVTMASTAAQALEELSLVVPDGVVTDLKMPGQDGLTLLQEMQGRQLAVPTVVLTGYGAVATAVEAMKLGARNYLVKPVNADQVLAAFVREPNASDEARLTMQTPSLARLEREHIERVLVECDGNVSKAARVLGIHRRTLQYKLAKYSVPR